ncbi:aa3-type cytochrome c oxidase subunit IV [Sphingomonas sp.]
MAEPGETPLREDTYSRFMTYVKWGTGISAAVTAFVVWLIAS